MQKGTADPYTGTEVLCDWVLPDLCSDAGKAANWKVVSNVMTQIQEIKEAYCFHSFCKPAIVTLCGVAFDSCQLQPGP